MYGDYHLSLNTFSKYLIEADNHIKKAQEQASGAEVIERSGKMLDAADQYFLAGREYFLATVNFRTILDILDYTLRVPPTDEKILDYKSKLINAYENSSYCYEKAAQLFEKSGNRFSESEAYGF